MLYGRTHTDCRRRAYETDDPQRTASSLLLHHRHDHWFADAGLCQGNEGLRGRIESPLGVLDLMDDEGIGELAQDHLDNTGVGQSAHRIGPGSAIPVSPRDGGVLLELLDELRERVEIGHGDDLPDLSVPVAARARSSERSEVSAGCHTPPDVGLLRMPLHLS